MKQRIRKKILKRKLQNGTIDVHKLSKRDLIIWSGLMASKMPTETIDLDSKGNVKNFNQLSSDTQDWIKNG